MQAHAQTNVSPGEVSRQLAPVRVPALPALQLQPQRITQPSAPAPGSQLIKVLQWDLQGHQLLSTESLLALLQPFTGVDVSLNQIREAAAAVQQAYEDAGWLARVDVPAQDITEGLVRLQITEARLGNVRLDPQATSLVQVERLQAWVKSGQAKDTVVNTRQLNRSLLLLDDLPGVSVTGSLQASGQPGATDVVLNAAAEPPYSLDLSLDNANARSIGATRISASGVWISPAGYGESYSAQAFKSKGSDYLRLGVNTPLGFSGWRTGLSFSQLDYAIVTPDMDGRAQDIQGRSQSAGVDLNYPLLRSRQANIYLNGSWEQRQYQGTANGQQNSHYQIEGTQIGLVGNIFDGWGGGAASSYSLSWRHGQVQSRQVAVSPEVLGSFDKFTWRMSRQQALRSDLSFFTAISGQNTGKKVLDGSENFSLGGPDGVRAYPVSEASGPQGRVINLELRWRISPQWLITSFYDHGVIENRTADKLSNYSLSGLGLSVTLTGEGGWTAQTTLAHRLGSNPNADIVTGNDRDGSLQKSRIWINVSRSL